MPCRLSSDVLYQMPEMDSNRYIAVFFMVCMKEVTLLKRSLANLLVQLVKSWVNITRTATNPFTTLWFEWLKNSLSATHWLMAKGTSAQSTEILLQLCVIQKAGSIVFPSICWKISKRKRLTSNRISMILKWSHLYYRHDFLIYS